MEFSLFFTLGCRKTFKNFYAPLYVQDCLWFCFFRKFKKKTKTSLILSVGCVLQQILNNLWQMIVGFVLHHAKNIVQHVIKTSDKRCHNIVADGWAGTPDPHPHCTPHPQTSIGKTFFQLFNLCLRTRDGWSYRPTDQWMDKRTKPRKELRIRNWKKSWSIDRPKNRSINKTPEHWRLPGLDKIFSCQAWYFGRPAK